MAHLTNTSVTAPALKRFSWGAILAGVAVAIVVHLVLSILGVAIGVSTIDPLQESNPVAGIGTGTAIYTLVISIIALFAGGFTAGSLAPIQDRRDRTLHGLTTWAVVTLVTFMLLTTVVGRIIGGTASMVTTGLEQVGQAASSVMQPVTEEVREQMREADIDIDMAAIRREARALLAETDTPELQPEEVEQEAEQLSEDIARSAEQAAQNPQVANQQLQSIFDRVQSEMRETIGAADQEALVNVLASRTDMSEQQAQDTVENWQQTYEQAYQAARQEFEALGEEAEQTAREWGEQAADAIATAAWWTVLMLVLNALAATIGANMGGNRPVLVTRTS